MPHTELVFNWDEPVICQNGDVLYPSDTLDRCKYADFLYQYLANNSSDTGYVLNLNAAWGSGKTYFINRWVESIKEIHPVVYIDAWKQDYSDDPMLTVISSIVSALNKHLPEGNAEVIEFGTKASRFFKSAAPLLAKGLIKKATGLNIDDVSTEEELEPSTGEDSKNSYNLTTEAGAALAKCLIDDHNEKLKTVEHLRTSLKNTIQAIQQDPEKPNKKPTFVFIDELDRCRPSYAVEMLEVIKHFFEIGDIVFVIATDTEQLQHAVKAVYGNDFDAQTYLGRFFKRRYSLSSLSRKEFVGQYLGGVETMSNWVHHCPAVHERSHLTGLVHQIADSFKLSLRETEQLTDKFLAVLNYTDKSFNTYLLLVLFVIREKHYSLYEFWTNSSNKNIYSREIVEELKLTNINLSSSIATGFDDFSFVTTTTGHSDQKTYFGLNEYLDLSLLYAWPMGESQRRVVLSDINQSIGHNTTDVERNRALYKQMVCNLSAKKIDYINWVELAVSFD
ncbi:KAP family NTPase [Shewanella sp. 1_MG-2023]|uniref:KAP family P-loop NTPase fold protein n=1 Tax=unclassified Shewanella TaxID=196818 RepID=UPI0026E324F2|nr:MULTISPECIES: KAP family NTPase [unclassified Shewanella]MDO6611625.1 KAP family NTPase [Shewanella sp. 7_MG-2023]MDO6771480.1 KAP family NTPase [Shewanella sp. 2_MG-2023]MDO6793871.1 KAP family NTPase [Shewanella sp. 1_MG-2023]